MSILWHFRLGHPSFNKLSSLQDILTSFYSKCNDICTICPLAKQKRLPFPSNNNMSTKPFALIHVDVWGPYSVCTYDGFRFFLTIVDDATRSTWVYLMKAKSDVKQLLISFYNMILTQCNIVLKQSDQIMLLNFLYQTFIVIMALCIKRVVLIHLSKILWLRESTNIFWMLLDLLKFIQSTLSILGRTYFDSYLSD